MRIKFPDQPEKFMESEIDLHEALQVRDMYTHTSVTITFSNLKNSGHCC